MQWTKERTTRFGTGLQKRGRWHGVPYVVQGFSTKGMTPQGRVAVLVAALLLLAALVAKELLL